MSMLMLLAVLAGAVLGMRFKVLILVPAIGLMIVAVLVGGIVRGDGVSIVTITAFLAASCTQIGYLGGTVTRHTMTLLRAGRLRAISLRSGPGPVTAPGHSTGGAAASTQYRG
jgi:hypothetical protein